MNEKNESITDRERNELWKLGLKTIKELETDRGILASDRTEIYGCIFGRDSLITGLKLLKAYRKTRDAYFLSVVKKILVNLAKLQGTEHNLESGEEPGKIIHEFREAGHEHLTKHAKRPWYVYPDNAMRNYDSVDSTPLFLIAVKRYVQSSGDEEFRAFIMPFVEKALGWMHTFDALGLGFIVYEFHAERVHGGLATQSWMDSSESLFHEDSSPVPYPIAAVEVQAYAYLAYRLWNQDAKAESLKRNFNERFVLQAHDEARPAAVAFALDGAMKPLASLRSSIGHILWASLVPELDGARECILYEKYIPDVVSALMSPELFEPMAGIRTLSKRSVKYDPESYHNGSIWPHDTSMAATGLDAYEYAEEARRVRTSLVRAWNHFKKPLELFSYTDAGFKEYESPTGQRACSKQAWSAASILAEI